MWLSEIQAKRRSAASPRIADATACPAAVMDGGELRELPVLRSGGAYRLPEEGEAVLTLICADGSRIIAGTLQERTPEGLSPGDVLIEAGSASILLRRDGGIAICGDVTVSGSLTVNGVTVG